MAERLQATGFLAEHLWDAESALQRALAGSHPDVWIIDVLLPTMDGLELAQRIRRLQQTASILLITGYPEQIQHFPRVTWHIQGYLEKPFTLDQLVTKVRDMLKDREA